MSSVFMSHSSADKPIVRRLAGRIKSAGHTVWLDEEQLHVGDSLVDHLGESVTTADFVVVALSPSSVASPWVRQELNAALADQIERSQTKVLPVLVRPCEIPPLLRGRIYADVSYERFDEGADALIATLAYHDKHGGRLPTNPAESARQRTPVPPGRSKENQAERLREFVHSSLQLSVTRGMIFNPILEKLTADDQEEFDDEVVLALLQVPEALRQVDEVRETLRGLGADAFADHFDMYYRFAENLERRAGVLQSLDRAGPDAPTARLLQLAHGLRELTSEAHHLTAELTLELLEAREPDEP